MEIFEIVKISEKVEISEIKLRLMEKENLRKRGGCFPSLSLTD